MLPPRPHRSTPLSSVNCSLQSQGPCPDHCSSVVWVLFYKAKSHQFNSRSEHVPRGAGSVPSWDVCVMFLKFQSSRGKRVQLAVPGGVLVINQGECLPATKTTHRRGIPKMDVIAKAQTNVHASECSVPMEIWATQSSGSCADGGCSPPLPHP